MMKGGTVNFGEKTHAVSYHPDGIVTSAAQNPESLAPFSLDTSKAIHPSVAAIISNTGVDGQAAIYLGIAFEDTGTGKIDARDGTNLIQAMCEAGYSGAAKSCEFASLSRIDPPTEVIIDTTADPVIKVSDQLERLMLGLLISPRSTHELIQKEYYLVTLLGLSSTGMLTNEATRNLLMPEDVLRALVEKVIPGCIAARPEEQAALFNILLQKINAKYKSVLGEQGEVVNISGDLPLSSESNLTEEQTTNFTIEEIAQPDRFVGAQRTRQMYEIRNPSQLDLGLINSGLPKRIIKFFTQYAESDIGVKVGPTWARWLGLDMRKYYGTVLAETPLTLISPDKPREVVIDEDRGEPLVALDIKTDGATGTVMVPLEQFYTGLLLADVSPDESNRVVLPMLAFFIDRNGHATLDPMRSFVVSMTKEEYGIFLSNDLYDEVAPGLEVKYPGVNKYFRKLFIVIQEHYNDLRYLK